MKQPSPRLKKVTYAILVMALVVSTSANLFLMRTLDRAIKAGEGLGAATEALLESDAALKKEASRLQDQVEICLDLKTRRVRYNLIEAVAPPVY